MTAQFILFAAVSVGLIAFSACYPTGAPQETCTLLTANHTGYLPQNSQSSYVIKINPSTLSSGSKATITLEGDSFKGFFIQAEDVITKKPVGKFTPRDSEYQTLSCGSSNTAATHVDPRVKHSINLDWEVPASYKGDIFFRGIVAQKKEIFWDNIRSGIISIA